MDFIFTTASGKECCIRDIENHWSSLRRHYVDEFFTRRIRDINKDGFVLDLGGTKKGKKGSFHASRHELNVLYANYSLETFPDLGIDAHQLPVKDEIFDYVICSEVLEHVRDALTVLGEIHRVLKGGGMLILSSPFMYPIHADPMDYGRFTDKYYSDHLTSIGFEQIAVEKQGGYWSVLFDMARGWSMDREIAATGTKEKLLNWLNVNLQPKLKKKALLWDSKSEAAEGFFMKGCTTGFGIVCRKK